MLPTINQFPGSFSVPDSRYTNANTNLDSNLDSKRNGCGISTVNWFILLHEKFLQFDWLRAVVFQLNLKYLRVKITKPLRVVV